MLDWHALRARDGGPVLLGLGRPEVPLVLGLFAGIGERALSLKLIERARESL